MAMVAIQLNMKKEAEQLYKVAKRWDLLTQMYQCDGKYQESVDICNSHNRINLNNSYFQMATNHANNHKYKEAIHFYNKSNTHKQHVIKMLVENNQLDLL